jgi:hypothetical protein
MEKLNLKYRIVENHDEFYTFTVRYWADPLTEEDLRFSPNSFSDGSPERCKTDVSITITDEIQTEKDLHDKIANSAPIVLLKNEIRKKTTNLDDILKFVHSSMNKIYEKEIKSSTDIQDQYKDLSDQEIEDILSDITSNKT